MKGQHWIKKRHQKRLFLLNSSSKVSFRVLIVSTLSLPAISKLKRKKLPLLLRPVMLIFNFTGASFHQVSL
ncbi:hypothetical protein HYD71_00705 [Mycoplasmopsis bovis]|nr:hypothetical protein [Mycoplasmopsis bovis]QQH49455.1 hypothetical protein HYD71_00705 [Mycoplasmopsis bovis]